MLLILYMLLIAPRACWYWQVDTSVGNEHAFVSLLNDFFLEQVNKTPTRGNSVLDLVITSVLERVKVSEVLKPMSTEISTDHSAIIFDLSLLHIPNPKIKRTVFDYRRADFDGLRSHIQSLDLDKLISDHGKIDHDWFAWKKSFMNAVAHFVPTKNLRSGHHLPWVNSLILHNIKKKNSLRKK